MGLESCLSWINRFGRIISICIGVLSIVCWILHSLIVGAETQVDELIHDKDCPIFFLLAIMSIFVHDLAVVVISALMVFGTVKRIATYILPWLAIHFGLALSHIVKVFCFIFFLMFVERAQHVIYSMFLSMLYSVLLIFSCSIVYLHWKNLAFSTQMQSTYPKNGQILRTREETKEQSV